MTIYGTCFGAESRDALVDGYSVFTALTGWSIVTSPKKTGTAAWRVNVNGSQSTTPVAFWGGKPSTVTNNLRCMMGWFTQSGAPSAAYSLGGRGTVAEALNLEVNTDSKIRLVYNPFGLSWADRVALTGWSTDSLPEDDSTFAHVALFFDRQTLGATHHWATLLINEVEQWSLDLGNIDSLNNSFNLLPAVANAGIYVTHDDAGQALSNTAGDAPHLTIWPVMEAHAQHPNSDVQTEWWRDAAKTLAGRFEEWDDATGNDGDTTFNFHDAVPTDRQQIGGGESAATMGVTGHAVLQEVGTPIAGPRMNFVHKNNDGTKAKFAGQGHNSLGSVVLSGAPSTSYSGQTAVMLRSSGTWSLSDIDAIEFGLGIPYGATHDMPWRVSLLLLMWTTYIDTLPLTTTPTIPGAARRIFIS